MYNDKKKKGIIGVIITIIILVLLVAITNAEKSKTYLFENIISKIVTPVQNGFTFLKNKIEGNSDFFANLDELKEENKKLKEQNISLEQSVRELEVLRTENQTLKEYLNLTEKYKDYKTTPAYVINKEISNYSKVMVINVGKNDGITENMPVITEKGLVGHVISVTSNTAKVQTIIDSSSSTSCISGSSRDSMVCKGTIENKGKLTGTYISSDAKLVSGDSVETSGIGGIFPKGIYVGKITKIIEGTNKTDVRVEVETAVDFNKVESVLVITQK